MTARLRSGALPTELTDRLTSPSLESMTERTRQSSNSEARAPLARATSNLACNFIQRDAGGSRTHFEAALQAAAVPSGSSVILSVLARNRTWSSTFAGSHANPAHPEDVNSLSSPPRS